VKFVVDAQLPPALANWINQHGHEAKHVFDLNLISTDDAAIWSYAVANGVVIISKDEDFVDQFLVSVDEVTLVWVRKGNCTTKELLAWFEPFWGEITRRIAAGERLVEVRG